MSDTTMPEGVERMAVRSVVVIGGSVGAIEPLQEINEIPPAEAPDEDAS